MSYQRSLNLEKMYFLLLQLISFFLLHYIWWIPDDFFKLKYIKNLVFYLSKSKYFKKIYMHLSNVGE